MIAIVVGILSFLGCCMGYSDTGEFGYIILGLVIGGFFIVAGISSFKDSGNSSSNRQTYTPSKPSDKEPEKDEPFKSSTYSFKPYSSSAATVKSPAQQTVTPGTGSGPAPKPTQTVFNTPVKYENAKLNEAAVRYLKDTRKANYLVHFTPVDNVEGILKYGILPRTQQTVKGKYSDPNRLDGHTDCSSFSISFPNYQMFYSKRMQNTYSYVVLEIDAEALNTVNRMNIAYFPHNAAKTELRGKFDSYTGLNALKDMFYEAQSRSSYFLPSSYTTDPQAEIMIRIQSAT